MNYLTLDSKTCTIPLRTLFHDEREPSLLLTCKEASKEGLENIILDFREVDHMDSEGLSTLVKLIIESTLEDRKLFVFGLNRDYHHLLSITGVLQKLIPLPENLKTSGLSTATQEHISAFKKGSGRQKTRGWLQDFHRISKVERIKGAYTKNLKNRTLLSPLQGFGPIWEKTYTLKCHKEGITPQESIEILKKNLPRFQPDNNDFYPSSKGIEAGEVLIINALTPGGLVSTGVVILYSDEKRFTFITPQGHPEAGWVSFMAHKKKDHLEIQIKGLASASDPFYELAFRLAGSQLQESIWKTVLSSMASYLKIEPSITIEKTCLKSSLQWSSTPNLWYNAQLRSLPFTIPFLLQRTKKTHQRGE